MLPFREGGKIAGNNELINGEAQSDSPFSPPRSRCRWYIPCKNRNKRITDGWMEKRIPSFLCSALSRWFRKISFPFSIFSRMRLTWWFVNYNIGEGRIYSCFSCVESTIEERCDYSIWRNFDFFFFFNSILEEKIEFYSTYFFQVSSVEDGLCNYLVWSTKREKKGGWFWLKEREIIRKLNLEIFFIWSFIFEKIKFENFIFFASFHICSRIWRGDGRKSCNHSTARERLKKK